MEEMICPWCESDKINKDGFKPMSIGRIQWYRCSQCGHRFREMRTEKGYDCIVEVLI